MQKELAQIEAKMQTLEAQRNELHAVMANKLAAAELAEKGKLLKQIDQELPALEARWLELTGQLESATAAS
jgi:ATP-binding cassette subfamily F protein 3